MGSTTTEHRLGPIYRALSELDHDMAMRLKSLVSDFETLDVERIASALDVDPFALMLEAADR
ncbi:hypothetical protein [Cellulomonas composti]|uniref:Uncharacterized protein n=1 Tax=Cellulomonas composti TaxID=266130 RepID=A0A511J9N7_9CELL|nr:hypothetical protein [Cellulomonas composti]GEL94700.1 hypothetical protein CCO02nite_13580 [Cellulomonas composti]